MIIENVIKNITIKAELRFCTPGHKGALNSQDITEIEGVFPLRYVKNAQINAAKTLNVKYVRFLGGGSSMGIKAALLNSGDILAAKNSHQSIAETAALSKANLFLIPNKRQNGLSLPLTPKQIKIALNKNPSVKTVVLTSPDYYGITAQIDAAKAIKDAGRRLYVDAAHGAHFLFRPDLFDCKIFKLADAFNLSAHKTLHSLTQTAFLAVNNPSLIKQIDQNLKLLGTTSPFYPFYSSLENSIDFTLQNKGGYDGLKAVIDGLKKEIPCVKNDDFTRLVVDAERMGTDGKSLFDGLLREGIIPEKYDKKYVVFIITLADKTEDITRLKEVLRAQKGANHA